MDRGVLERGALIYLAQNATRPYIRLSEGQAVLAWTYHVYDRPHNQIWFVCP